MTASEPRDPRELLDAEEERLVRDWLDDHPEGRVELDELARVRTRVRELPAVDPPFGFFERMLLDGTAEPADAAAPRPSARAHRRPSRRRRVYAGLAGVGASVAAALVLVLGITPVTDKVVPPVNAFAERHDAMTSGREEGASTSPSSSSSSTSTTSSTAAPTTSAPTTATTSSDAGGFTTMTADRVEAMQAPFVAPARLDSYDRTSVYVRSGVVHVMYGHDGEWLSMYEQPGTVDWDHMPADGRPMTVHDDRAWETTVGRQAVLVIDHDGVVVTVVSSGPADDMMRAAASVPAPAAPSMSTRMQRGAADLVRSFGLG